jgi:hypothetical protein
MRPRNRSSEARNHYEVHPLATALDCHIVVADAAVKISLSLSVCSKVRAAAESDLQKLPISQPNGEE